MSALEYWNAVKSRKFENTTSWYVKHALKSARRRDSFMSTARDTQFPEVRAAAVRFARDNNHELLWALSGARRFA